MTRRGRPTSLTTEMADQIIKLIHYGHAPSTVAPACGIYLSTMRGWLKLGQRRSKKYALHRDFLARYRRATPQRIMALERNVFDGYGALDPELARKVLSQISPRWNNGINWKIRQLERAVNKLMALTDVGAERVPSDDPEV